VRFCAARSARYARCPRHPQEPLQAALHPVGLELNAVFMLVTCVVFVGYGLFAASIRDHVITRPRVLTWMRRMVAAAFVALGPRSAFSER
jgi:threonine/homoserine/homoserine lactone efflux protein